MKVLKHGIKAQTTVKECKSCGAVLELEQNDMKFEARLCNGGVKRSFKCPDCGSKNYTYSYTTYENNDGQIAMKEML